MELKKENGVQLTTQRGQRQFHEAEERRGRYPLIKCPCRHMGRDSAGTGKTKERMFAYSLSEVRFPYLNPARNGSILSTGSIERCIRVVFPGIRDFVHLSARGAMRAGDRKIGSFRKQSAGGPFHSPAGTSWMENPYWPHGTTGTGIEVFFDFH